MIVTLYYTIRQPPQLKRGWYENVVVGGPGSLEDAQSLRDRLNEEFGGESPALEHYVVGEIRVEMEEHL